MLDLSIIFFSDLDECGRQAYYCHKFATCTNTRGSYSCKCNKGYTGNGFECYHYAGETLVIRHLTQARQLWKQNVKKKKRIDERNSSQTRVSSSLKDINSIGVFKKIITVADLGDQLQPLTLEGDIDDINKFPSFLPKVIFASIGYNSGTEM